MGTVSPLVAAADNVQNHKIDQKLTCIGCQMSFYRACLFIEHLEFGYCKVIPASQFQAHIIHKYLITELLKGGEAYTRFQQKQAKFEATLDIEQEGGVDLGDVIFDDEEIDEVQFEAIKPDVSTDTPTCTSTIEPFPPLAPKLSSADVTHKDLTSTLGSMSLYDKLKTSTVVNSPIASPVAATSTAGSFHSNSDREITTTEGPTPISNNRQIKFWGSRDGKSTSNILFPGAERTPVPSEFSITAHDDSMEQAHGLNIMQHRFWDPNSNDFNPNRFYDAIIDKFYCPFVCE